MTTDRYFSQPSTISSHSTYILDRTVPCDCEGDHTAHPAYGNCAKIVMVVESKGTARALDYWNRSA